MTQKQNKTKNLFSKAKPAWCQLLPLLSCSGLGERRLYLASTSASGTVISLNRKCLTSYWLLSSGTSKRLFLQKPDAPTPGTALQLLATCFCLFLSSLRVVLFSFSVVLTHWPWKSRGFSRSLQQALREVLDRILRWLHTESPC